MLGTLVAGMAHEINNPITYLLANLAELERLGAATRDALDAYKRAFERVPAGRAEPIRAAEVKLEGIGGLDLADELLEECNHAAARIRDLVRDLLALARPDTEGPPTHVDVHALLELVLRMLKVELRESAQIVRDYAAARPVQAPKGALTLVLLNLIRNAAQACAARAPDEARIALRTRDLASEVEIAVEDNGGGVPPEAHARLFAPFFTTKPDGTGLGLCVSRRIVEQQGGALEYLPAPGGGSIFTVRLPHAR